MNPNYLKTGIIEKCFPTEYGDIVYLESGTGENTIIWFHGGLTQPSWIKYLCNVLTISNFRVVCPYLPGHGKSYRINRNTTYEDYLVATEKFVSHIKQATPGSLVLGGNSFGGRLAYDLGQRDKDKAISKIVLSVPLVKPFNRSPLAVCYFLLSDYIRDSNYQPTDFAKEIKFKPAHFGSSLTFWKLLQNLPSIELLKSKLPTMVLWGINDTVLPLRNNIDALDGCDFEKFDGGHFFMLRDPERFRDVFESFLSEPGK